MQIEERYEIVHAKSKIIAEVIQTDNEKSNFIEEGINKDKLKTINSV
jgi:hypothetical protein